MEKMGFSPNTSIADDVDGTFSNITKKEKDMRN